MKGKRLLALLLSLLMALSLAACGGTDSQTTTDDTTSDTTADTTTDTTTDTEDTSDSTEATEDASDATEEADTATDATDSTESTDTTEAGTVQTENFTEEQQGMLPILDSILMTGADEYDAQSSEYVWNVLYLLLANWEPAILTTGDGSEAEGTTLYALQGVQECAFAAFGDLEDLPLDSISSAEGLSYDEGWDAIVVQNSDRGDSASEIYSWLDNGDGTYTVQVRGYSESTGETTDWATFQLRDNQNLSGITDPVYYYEVVSAQSGGEDAVYSVEAEYVGLADTHTAEFLIEDGAEAYQLADGIADLLTDMESGTVVIFHYTVDSETGTKTIVEILGE